MKSIIQAILGAIITYIMHFIERMRTNKLRKEAKKQEEESNESLQVAYDSYDEYMAKYGDSSGDVSAGEESDKELRESIEEATYGSKGSGKTKQ